LEAEAEGREAASAEEGGREVNKLRRKFVRQPGGGWVVSAPQFWAVVYRGPDGTWWVEKRRTGPKQEGKSVRWRSMGPYPSAALARSAVGSVR
jgi:hypothetical protein